MTGRIICRTVLHAHRCKQTNSLCALASFTSQHLEVGEQVLKVNAACYQLLIVERSWTKTCFYERIVDALNKYKTYVFSINLKTNRTVILIRLKSTILRQYHNPFSCLRFPDDLREYANDYCSWRSCFNALTILFKTARQFTVRK